MKKSYHSSAEPTAEASITRPSDDFSRTTPAPVASAVMVSLPDGSVIGCCDRPDASQPPGTRQAELPSSPPLAKGRSTAKRSGGDHDPLPARCASRPPLSGGGEARLPRGNYQTPPAHSRRL